MEILDPLNSDHDQIDRLLEKLELAESPSEKQEILRTLSVRLDTHFKNEEATVFTFLDGVPRLSDLLGRLFDEHVEINDRLNEARQLRDPVQLGPKTEALIDLILDHLDTEETELYPKIEAHLTDEELSDLSRRLASLSPEHKKAA